MTKSSYDQEIAALKTVLEALEPLEAPQRAFVLKAAAERLNVTGISLSSDIDDTTSNKPWTKNGELTPKAFLKQRQPVSAVEQIVCLAYYLTNYRNQANFKTIDLTRLNHEAGGNRISNPSVFARNAVSQNGFLAPSGGGRKRLTNLGESVVEALPDRDKVKEVLSRSKQPVGRKRKKSPSSS